MKRFPVMPLGLALAGLALGVPILAPAEADEPRTAPAALAAGQALPTGRAALWRAIFARPPAAEPSPGEAAKIALGRDLFSDPRLSGGGRASCTSCHDPNRAFTDGRKTAVGPEGAALPRKEPHRPSQGADPRA